MASTAPILLLALTYFLRAMRLGASQHGAGKQTTRRSMFAYSSRAVGEIVPGTIALRQMLAGERQSLGGAQLTSFKLTMASVIMSGITRQ